MIFFCQLVAQTQKINALMNSFLMMALNILDVPQSIIVSHGVLLKLIAMESSSNLIGKTVEVAVNLVSNACFDIRLVKYCAIFFKHDEYGSSTV